MNNITWSERNFANPEEQKEKKEQDLDKILTLSKQISDNFKNLEADVKLLYLQIPDKNLYDVIADLELSARAFYKYLITKINIPTL